MNDTPERAQRESIILRALWMLVFLVVWQLAELLLGGLVLVQLIYRLVYGAPSASLMNFGDSLSQYLAQIGRFGSFHSDQKPWPFADWPAPRAPEGEAPHAVAPAPHPVPRELRCSVAAQFLRRQRSVAAHGLRHHVQALDEQLVGDGQRRQEADDVAVGAAGERDDALRDRRGGHILEHQRSARACQPLQQGKTHLDRLNSCTFFVHVH